MECSSLGSYRVFLPGNLQNENVEFFINFFVSTNQSALAWIILPPLKLVGAALSQSKKPTKRRQIKPKERGFAISCLSIKRHENSFVAWISPDEIKDAE
jgi:hypothetical protein